MNYFHHMRASICMIGLLASTLGWAQNLVPNGSFEEYSECPSFMASVQYAVGWQNLYNNSSDYFHRCHTGNVVGVPLNQWGCQEPAHGDAYVGLVTTAPGADLYREIVGIALTEPLQAGVPVCLSFQMAVGGFGSWPGNSAVYTAKGVGIRFFMGFPADWTSFLYPNNAAIYMDEVPADTAIWYSVNDIYIPDSNYTHLAIANFFSNALSDVIRLDTSGVGTQGTSYAFIDDVRVSFDLAYCTVAAVPSGYGRSVGRVYPNPGVGRFTVSLPTVVSGPVHWQLVNAYGKLIYSGNAMTEVGEFVIEVAGLAAGSYVLRIMDDFGAYAPVRLLSVSP